MSISCSNVVNFDHLTMQKGRYSCWMAALLIVASPSATWADTTQVIKFHALPKSLIPSQWPMLGSPEAPIILLELFDYTCGSCQQMATQLTAVREIYGDNMGVVALPLVLGGPHADKSRQFARLALSVFLTDRTRFAEFHEWLFTGPSIAEAHDRAAELVGADQLHAQLENSRIDKFLNVIQQMYTNSGYNKIPLLSSEAFTLVGLVKNDQELFESIERYHPVTR